MEEIDTSEMTMGEILELRKTMGSKQFAKSVTHPKVAKLKGKEIRQTKEKETVSKRSYQLEKNAPEEVSSKKKPPKLRQVVEVPNTKKITDPRFNPEIGEFSHAAFDKRFDFIADIEAREKNILKKKLKKVKNAELKQNMHNLVNRIDQKAITRKNRQGIREREAAWKKEEREKQKDGKTAFYRKRGEIAKEFQQEIIEKATSKMSEHQLAKKDAAREKKQARKDKSSLPVRRNVF
ncbi:unnamed protein product [Oikopleura dioica]|uniref:rRNA biogenesis protein RRP36 n=1 Tax=Oikopleura dioica TaxID=34765 RepID=E4YYT0_OIKDI|nr:unnamed protein product [Oikopleura dioica]